MSELTADLAAEVVAACQAGAEEAAGALSRSLDADFAITVGEAGSYSPDAAPAGFDGPGLVVLMKFGEVGAAALIPESSGLLPDWYSNPDPTGESKLSTLAQELSMLLVPETLMAETFEAARVENLSTALGSADVAGESGLVPLSLSAGDASGEMTFIWPLSSPDALFPQPADAEEPAAEPGSPPSEGPAKTKIEDFSQLPGYSRSLLRIELPVRVVLASKKENLNNIVELASGSIIKFDKACDEMLHLQVGEQKIAVGEAVKVGDKFGIRVSNMVMPDEHFMKVRPKKTG